MSKKYCKIDREAGTFTLQLATWHNTYPLETLERWRDFYVEQRSIFPKCRDTYDETIALLENALAESSAG